MKHFAALVAMVTAPFMSFGMVPRDFENDVRQTRKASQRPQLPAPTFEQAFKPKATKRGKRRAAAKNK